MYIILNYLKNMTVPVDDTIRNFYTFYGNKYVGKHLNMTMITVSR